MQRLTSAVIILLTLHGVPAAQHVRVDFKHFELENGLRVVISPDRSAPVVAVAVYYDVGSRNEVPGRSGFAHLFEHMMFQGSENIGKAEHFKYVESNGGYLNASTHVDFTNYYQFMPSNRLELALWLESDRMRSLRISEENLANQKEAVKEEKRLGIDNQAYWPALLKMEEMVFHNWANSHSTIGSMEDLDAATVDDVQAFFNRFYSPNNAVLAIVGDVEIAAAERMVRKYFDSIPRKDTPPPVDVSEPFETVEGKREVGDPLAEVPAFAVTWKIPPRRSDDFYAISVLRSILFEGGSSRVYNKLVSELGVALDAQSFFEPRRGPGSASLLVIHRPDVEAARIQSLIEAEIEELTKSGVSEGELVKAKNQHRLDLYTGGGGAGEYESLQTALGRAKALAEHTMFDGDPSLINTEIERYMSVTRDRVREAARKYFGERNRSILVIRPAASRNESKE